MANGTRGDARIVTCVVLSVASTIAAASVAPALPMATRAASASTRSSPAMRPSGMRYMSAAFTHR